MRYRRALFVVVALTLLAGCAMTGGIDEQLLPADLPPQAGPWPIPYFEQEAFQCGPAAMAMVLQWSGVNVSPETLAPEIFIPEKKGSLQSDLVTAARRHGRLAYPIRGMPCLLESVAAGQPVVVLQNLGLGWLPRWHYAVVTGYDLPQRQIIMHTGPIENRRTGLATFGRTWQRADTWALVVLPAEQLPVCAEEPAYLQAALGLQQAGRVGDAATAFRLATRRWPGSVQAVMALGNALYLSGDLHGAAEAFHQATELAPANGDAFNNLAHVLARRGKLDQAETAARKALAIGGPRRATYLQTLQEITDLQSAKP